MRQYAEHGGLYATTFNLETGRPVSNTYSVGAMADSAYEYFLKEWLLTGKTEQRYLDMCTCFLLDWLLSYPHNAL